MSFIDYYMAKKYTDKILTSAPSLTGATLASEVAITGLGSEISPGIATWSGADGATWDGAEWDIPSGGSISANVNVTADKTYLITITITPINNVGRMKVSLGTNSLLLFSGTDGNYSLTLVANETGSVALTLGESGGAWEASVQNVSVKEVTSLPTTTATIGTDMTVRSYVNNIAVGGGHSKRTGSLSYNSAIGYLAQNDISTGKYNNAFGARAQKNLIVGGNNNAFGYQSQYNLTTGFYNNAFGYAAQMNLITGSWNNAFGNEAQIGLTTGDNNVGMGRLAQFALTTGSGNVGIGARVQYIRNNSITARTITASNQTCIGFESGQSSATQADNLTAIGYRANGATNATAIGANASAGGVGSVAIGTDSAGNGATSVTQDEISLGTIMHMVRILGNLKMPNIPTADPGVAGQLWSNSGVLTVSAG
jgi:hypothetical protein